MKFPLWLEELSMKSFKHCWKYYLITDDPWHILRVPCPEICIQTRMHSSRIRTDRFSCCHGGVHPPVQAHPLTCSHTPLSTTPISIHTPPCPHPPCPHTTPPLPKCMLGYTLHPSAYWMGYTDTPPAQVHAGIHPCLSVCWDTHPLSPQVHSGIHPPPP